MCIYVQEECLTKRVPEPPSSEISPALEPSSSEISSVPEHPVYPTDNKESVPAPEVEDITCLELLEDDFEEKDAQKVDTIP